MFKITENIIEMVKEEAKNSRNLDMPNPVSLGNGNAYFSTNPDCLTEPSKIKIDGKDVFVSLWKKT